MSVNTKDIWYIVSSYCRILLSRIHSIIRIGTDIKAITRKEKKIKIKWSYSAISIKKLLLIVKFTRDFIQFNQLLDSCPPQHGMIIAKSELTPLRYDETTQLKGRQGQFAFEIPNWIYPFPIALLLLYFQRLTTDMIIKENLHVITTRVFKLITALVIYFVLTPTNCGFVQL